MKVLKKYAGVFLFFSISALFFSRGLLALTLKKNPKAWDAFIKREVVISDSEYCLDQLIKVRADRQRLKQISLSLQKVCFQVKPGEKLRQLSKKEISQELMQHELAPRKLYGPYVRVKFSMRNVSEGQMKDLIMADLRRHKDYVLNTEKLEMLYEKLIHVPFDSAIRVKVKPYNYRAGRKTALLQILKGKKVVQQQEHPFYLYLYNTVFKTKKEIKPMQVITASDVLTKKQKVLTGSIQSSNPIGSIAKRAMPVGHTINKADIEKDYAVKPGRYLELIYENGSIAIELEARALRHASVGEVIPVRSTKLNRIFQAKVISKTKAVMEH